MTAGANYIYYGGASLPAPPFTCNDVRFMSLPCAGDELKIQEFVDGTLNAVTRPGRYRTLSRYVFLALMAAQTSGSTTPPYSTYGTMPETDIGFWIPLTDAETPAQVCWYPAYLFVDNWLAVVGGREIWGFPKAWATIAMGPGDPRDSTIAVSTLAVKTLQPTSQAEMAEIFRLAPGDGGAPSHNAVGGEPLIAALLRLFADELVAELAEVMTKLFRDCSFAGSGSPMILLKQVRDASSVTAAGYRSAIVANAAMTALHGMSLRGAYTLTLNDYATQPIAADLGLALGEQRLPFAFCANLNFTMGLGVPVPPG